VEQLNIVGKRSGEGFVSHKATMVNALSRGLADRLTLMDFTIGRKGFLSYIKALAGSNIVKIVPASNGNASGERVADKRLKVVCGSNSSYLEDMAWIGDKTPMTFADVRIHPHNIVKPNIGSVELSEALTRVLPFTATDEARPVLQCVLFKASEGKLQLVSADGFRLAILSLNYDDGEGQVLVNRDELKGIASALRKAKRVRLAFEASGDTLEGLSLVIDTEAIRYKWRGAEGQFPNYEQLIPSEFSTIGHLDTVEASKAIASLIALTSVKAPSIDLNLEGGYITVSTPDSDESKTSGGEAVIPADIEGTPNEVRVDGKYLADVLKAFGGMVDFSLSKPYSPVLFSSDGFMVVVMPIMSQRANEQQRQDREAKEAEATAEAEAIAEAQAKPKRSRSRKRQPVAVA